MAGGGRAGGGAAEGGGTDAMSQLRGMSPPSATPAAPSQPAPGADAARGTAGPTPETIATSAARAKLAPELRDLAQKLAAAGTKTLREGNLRVDNGQVKIRVKLGSLSEQVLAALKKLGFQEASRNAPEKQVVGTLAVSRLEDLARLQEVQQIDPAQ